MSRWTHAQCRECWYNANPGRTPRVLREPETERCCFCGSPTDSGIYVRADPAVTLCHGDHETFAAGDGKEVTHMDETRSEDFAAEPEEAAEAEGTEAAEAEAEAEGQDDEAGSPE